MARRLVVGILALVVLAWLGVMERDARLQARGVEAAREPGGFARAEADLRAARLLNPDSTPDFARAVLYQGAGRPAQASALAEAILRREPENLTAWGLLLAIERGRDPAAVRRAIAAQRRLDPVNAFRRR